MATKDELIKRINSHTNFDNTNTLNNHDVETLIHISNIMSRPDVFVRVNRDRAPYGLLLSTATSTIVLDNTYTQIDNIYINGSRFGVNETSLDAVDKVLSGVDGVKEVIGERQGYQATGRRARRVRRQSAEIDFEALQADAEAELQQTNLDYETIYDELSGLLIDSGVDPERVVNEVMSNQIEQKDLPHFLTHESDYHQLIVARATNNVMNTTSQVYNYEPITADDSFIGRLMTTIGVEEAEYDREQGVLNINGRLITNLPTVDENGIFSNGDKKYIPYHIGYFVEGDGSRIDRLRHVDPVQNALDAVKLQYDLSQGDIKFQTLLDVTRNLPDFETHPKGAEILSTLKNKVVLDKQYANTNSLHAEFNNRADDLGAVALMMLDDDAKYLIDPLGTSNGGNMGKIFYLTEDAQFNADGTLSKGTKEYSAVGAYLSEFYMDKDNFNRNQMSFNAFLTSTDVQELNVAFAEAAMFNAEDGKIMTDSGAKKFEHAEFGEAKRTGDKMQDFHGNKGVIPIVIDREMSDQDASDQRLKHLVDMAKLNPDLDIIESPISVASRLNMGVAHEGLNGKKQDLYLPNGDIVKDGITTMMYMSLPQTAEHKSKDYGVEGNGRRYSTLFRYALASKVGEEFYNQAFMDENVRNEHIDEIATAFQRLGVTFKDEKSLVTKGNTYGSVQAKVTISMDDLAMMTPIASRDYIKSVMAEHDSRDINIDLGDQKILSPLTKQPISDEYGRNVLPIRIREDGSIPFRYNDVFKHLAIQNVSEFQRSYDRAIANDYSQLTRKNNLLKNIDTMTFTEGAHTDVIVPDPRLDLNDVRTTIDSERVIIHRDPAIQSGNAITMNNVGGGDDNVMHINPLVVYQQDGDFDGDTEGVRKDDNQNRMTDEEKEMFYYLSNVTEQLNQYGEVFLPTNGGHFKAAAIANDIDISGITFDTGKTNAEVANEVNNITRQIVDNVNSYGAYALSFTDENTVKNTIGKLADDGIKGDRETLSHHFENGYTPDENRAIMKALIAKSEWTGLAGAVTNSLIANMGDQTFDPELVRTSFDITHTMTQSVLQMKKNADKLPIIDGKIAEMKKVMAGNVSPEEARESLKDITEGLIPEAAVDKFVDLVNDRQLNVYRADLNKFGNGVINGTQLSTTQLAYKSGDQFADSLNEVIAQTEGQQR